MSVPPDQMMAMQGGPPAGPAGPAMGGPPGMGAMPPPNLLPFASTQPGGIEQLMAPLLQQQQMDLEAVKQQQLEAVMGVVMQAMQQAPNPAAAAAQTEPAPPMDGSMAMPGGGGMGMGMGGGGPMDQTNDSMPGGM